MNKQRILALAAVIETLPHVDHDEDEGFNMSTYMHIGCNTPSCIAGHAVAIWRPAAIREGNYALQAGEILDLDVDIATELFCPHTRNLLSKGMTIDSITPQQAADTLRRLAQNGDVSWERDQS